MAATAQLTIKPITFEVLGVPAPQGSKSAVRRGNKTILIEGKTSGQRAKHRAWREAVAWKAAEAIGEKDPLDGPLAVYVQFRLPMPKSRPAKSRKLGIGWHAVQPDIDKLIRSTFDGLTDGGLIADDARVARVYAQAVEVTGHTGADIVVSQLGLGAAQ